MQELAEPIRQMTLSRLQRVNHQVENLKIGLEIPTVPLVLALQAFGMTLWSINPKQSSRFGDRFSVAGTKDERRNAQVIASALRTDQHAFRNVPALAERHSAQCAAWCIAKAD